MINRERPKPILNTILEINILLILFCLPFSKSIVEICVGVSIASFLLKKIVIEKSLKADIDRKVLIWLGLFIFFNILSNINSQFIHLSLTALFSKALKWAAFFIVVADTIKTRQQLRRIFITMLFSATLILADAAYQQYITGIDFLHYPNRYEVFKFHDRSLGATTFPTASFPFPSDFAAWLNVYLFTFLFMGYFYLRECIKVYGIVVSILSILVGFFLFLTTSAGALLGTLFSTTIILITNIKRLLVPIMVFFIIIILATSFIPYLRVYLKDGILDERLSVDDRVNMWSVGWKIFKLHPFFGNGINTFFEHFKSFRVDEDKFKKGSYAHNCFLQMASDIGLLGLASFLFFVFCVIFQNMKRISNLSTFTRSFISGLSLGIIAFLVHSFFDTNLYSLNLSALFWLSMGVVEGVGYNTSETP